MEPKEKKTGKTGFSDAELKDKRYTRSGKKPGTERILLFSKINFRLLYMGIALVVAGFALMAIEGKFEGFLSLYICPFLIVGGLAEILWAIVRRVPEPREETSNK